MDLSKIKKIYMIGIKGVGMTMLAQYFAAKKVSVTGSDNPDKFMTDNVLKRSGIKITEKFDRNNLPKDAGLIVYSTAYTAENNEELAASMGGKIKVMSYPQALAGVFNKKYGIAVVGSHGKTTTSAWLGFTLDQAGKNPTVMVGSNVPQFGGACLVGASDYLVAELDEYQNKLKYFEPKAVLLNNIDYDHPDYFLTEDSYLGVFTDFLKKIPPKGFLVANYDDAQIRKVAQVNCRGWVITYAINEAADFVAYGIKSSGGAQYFKVKMAGDGEDEESMSDIDLGDFSIKLAGRHNISNALAVIAACVELDIPLVEIRRGLEEFSGTTRRMEILGRFNGADIIDDYAHHPTELKATLAGARELYPGRKIIVVFHPHTYTRTLALLDDFAKSFGQADEVIVLDIYGSAREKQGGVHSRDLVEKITQHATHNTQQKVWHIPTLGECEKYLRENIERDDVVILMGAGDVFRIGENLLK